MDTKLREVLAEYNIDLQYISVTNFDFTDTFTDAVEAKVNVAESVQVDKGDDGMGCGASFLGTERR